MPKYVLRFSYSNEAIKNLAERPRVDPMRSARWSSQREDTLSPTI